MTDAEQGRAGIVLGEMKTSAGISKRLRVIARDARLFADSLDTEDGWERQVIREWASELREIADWLEPKTDE